MDVLKTENISPLQIFKLFDPNDDGKITKNEFLTALRNMKIRLTEEEYEIFFLFVDLDGSGVVEYREFLRKLKRNGVTKANLIMFF